MSNKQLVNSHFTHCSNFKAFNLSFISQTRFFMVFYSSL